MNKLAAIFILFLLITCKSTHAFECESWPYEGMPYFYAQTESLLLYSSPSLSAPFTEPTKIIKGSIVTFPYGVKDIMRRRERAEKRKKEADDKAKESANSSSVSFGGMIGNRGPIMQKTDIISSAPWEGRTLNTEIILDKSIQITIKPGITKAIRNGKFKVTESYGQINSCSEINKEHIESGKEFSFQQNDTIEYLLYLGENHCMFRFKGEVFMHQGCLGYLNEAFEAEQCLEREYSQRFKAKSDHKVEWWISIKKNNQEVGWTLIDSNNKMLKMIDTLK